VNVSGEVIYEQLVAVLIHSWREEFSIGRGQGTHARQCAEASWRSPCSRSQVRYSRLMLSRRTLEPAYGLEATTQSQALYVSCLSIRLSREGLGIQHHTTSQPCAALELSTSDCRGACQGLSIRMTSNKICSWHRHIAREADWNLSVKTCMCTLEQQIACQVLL
jgi:hypothetical protein